MIAKEDYTKARKLILECWGEEVISEVDKYESLNIDCDKFLYYCTACGGDWGNMLLSGVRELRPYVWDAIPDHMGENSFDAFERICNLLVLLGVDIPEQE